VLTANHHAPLAAATRLKRRKAERDLRHIQG
jgi:hypothetical protein